MKAKCEKCLHCKLINEYGHIICEYLKGVEPNKVAVMKPKYCPNFQSVKGARK